MEDAGGLTAANLAAFNAALFVAVASPGPAFLVCLRASLRGGRAEGIATGLGLAAMAGIWTLAALAGLDAFFDAFPALYLGMKLVGAVVILFIAVQTWRGARAPIADAPPSSGRRAFLAGFLMNLGNPKSILFAAGVLLIIFPPGLTALEMAVVTANHVALEALVYATLAVLMSRDAVRARYLAWKPAIARTMALVLGGLGLRLLLTR